MGYITLHIFLLVTVSTIATAYRVWTVTKYFQNHTFTATGNEVECIISTQVVVEGSTTAYLPRTDCPLSETRVIGEDVTPTTPLQGISTSTYTWNVDGSYGNITVYNVIIELSPDAVAVPSTTTTPPTIATEPTLNRGIWKLNNTKVQFVQPVLLTAPASCKPGTDTTYMRTLTHSSYSFTSTVSIILDEFIGDLVPQMAAAATSTGIVTNTDRDYTATIIQYVLPSDIFPVTITQDSYYSIDPCVDPRATPITTSSSSDARINANYQQAFIPAVLAAAAITVALLKVE